MLAWVIKIKKDGTYYAGCNKRNAQTLLGAQLYKSEKAIDTMMKKSINFHYRPEEVKKVPIELKEI
jgi:uncharacterized protein YegP (UPF0339 family)